MKKIILLLLSVIPIFASEINTGDTAFMLISTALVVLMAPVGLALFYSGMTKSKNVVNSFFMVYMAFFIAFFTWIIAGYSIAFGGYSIGLGSTTLNLFIGGFDNILLNGISFDEVANKQLGQMYPKTVFIAFQGAFAGITAAIIAGSVIERIKFSTWIIFTFIWTLIVYAPIAHMVWGGGYLFNLGTLDFAGGTVVHMTGGLAGLILALLIGKRLDFYKSEEKPSSIIFTATGAGLLLFGWFGFNGGSAFGSGSIAGLAYLTTITAGSIGVLSWGLFEYISTKKVTLLGSASGLIAGLVAITPAAGFVSVGGALIIGFLGSLISYIGIMVLKRTFKYDDSLDAFGIHFLAGLIGAIATGIFALNDKALLWDGPLKANGDRIGQIVVQFESVIIVSFITIIGTLISYFIAKSLTGGARIDESVEIKGLDHSIHGESGYHI